MTRPFHVIVVLLLGAVGMPGCQDGGPAGSGPFGLFTKSSQPDDRQFTVLLMKLQGEGHHKLATYYEQRTREYTGWKDIFVVHKDDHSLLFWGKHNSIDDAEPYLKQAKAFRSKDTGLRPFLQAMIVPLPGKDPGPPEWNVLSVPAEYSYTVLVADFFNIAEPLDARDKPYLSRKNDAVSLCKDLRDKGHEAYYHHGPSHSGVMIGKFDTKVVQVVKKPGQPPQRQVVGKDVLAIQKQFPYLAVNGYQQKNVVRDSKTGELLKDPRTGKPLEMIEKCRLIKIPGREVKEPTVRPPSATQPTPPDLPPRIFP